MKGLPKSADCIVPCIFLPSLDISFPSPVNDHLFFSFSSFHNVDCNCNFDNLLAVPTLPN